MSRRKVSGKRGSAPGKKRPEPAASGANVLNRLGPEEASTVLSILLKRHPGLRVKAEQVATELVSSSSATDIATDVFDRVMGVPLDALNGRAGAHSWGYVEPGQAACDLLAEAVEELIGDMKRSAEVGLTSAGEALCLGIVEGLYRARKTKSDNALSWAPDFPAEEACYVVEEFLQACHRTARRSVLKHLIEAFGTTAPEWTDMLQRTARDS